MSRKRSSEGPGVGAYARQTPAGSSPDACPVCDYRHRPGRCRGRQDKSGAAKVWNPCRVCGRAAKLGQDLCKACRAGGAGAAGA